MLLIYNPVIQTTYNGWLYTLEYNIVHVKLCSKYREKKYRTKLTILIKIAIEVLIKRLGQKSAIFQRSSLIIFMLKINYKSTF